MPEGRMLKKKISYDEAVNKLSLKAALLFTWCIPHLDVKGRIIGTPEYLKGNIVPFKNEIKLSDIPTLLKEIEKLHLVFIYGEDKYIQFNGFFKNQRIDECKESKSIIPEPTLEQLQSNSCVTPEEVKESKVKESKVNIPYSEIIIFLNQQTKKNYKPTTPKTKDLIQARFNEDFNFEDFKKVIQVKSKEWLTPNEVGKTPMAKYLRPETLFGTKFESYLQEWKPAPKKANPFCKKCDGTGSILISDMEERKKTGRVYKNCDCLKETK